MGTSSVSPSCPVPRPCTSVDRPCMQAPRGLWDTLRLRRLGRGATLRTGSPQAVSSGRSGFPDENDVRSSPPTYKDARWNCNLSRQPALAALVVFDVAIALAAG